MKIKRRKKSLVQLSRHGPAGFFYICVQIDFVDLTWGRVYISFHNVDLPQEWGGGGGYIWEAFWNVHLLMIEFSCAEVTLYDWRDVKIWLLNN